MGFYLSLSCLEHESTRCAALSHTSVCNLLVDVIAILTAELWHEKEKNLVLYKFSTPYLTSTSINVKRLDR